MKLNYSCGKLRVSIFLGILLCQHSVWAEDFYLKFERSKDKTIENLTWDESSSTQEPQVQMKMSPEQKPIYFVKLSGVYKNKAANVLYNNQKIDFTPEGKFTIEVEVDSDQENFSLLAIDEAGDVQKEKNDLVFKDWAKFLADQNKKPLKRITLIPGLGFSYINYSQTSVATISEIAVTPRFTGRFTLNEKISFETNAYYQALLLSDSPSGSSVQMLEFNVEGSYFIKKIVNERWQLKISAGYYYTTAFSNSASFGFNNVNGIDLFPQLSHTLPKDQSAWISFRYAPILNGLAFLSLNNTEMTIGAGYSFTPTEKKKRVISATFDIELLQLNLGGIQVNSNAYTLGGRYQF